MNSKLNDMQIIRSRGHYELWIGKDFFASFDTFGEAVKEYEMILEKGCVPKEEKSA